MLMVPHPRLGVDRLAYRSEHSNGVTLVALNRLCAVHHQGTDCRRGGVEGGRAVLVADVPEPPGVGVGRNPLEHQCVNPQSERAVDDVRVTGHPSDVGCAEVQVALRLEVEYVFAGGRRIHHVTRLGVQDSLRLASRARRVEDEKRVLSLHDFRFTSGTLGCHALLHVDIPAGDPPRAAFADAIACSVVDQHAANHYS